LDKGTKEGRKADKKAGQKGRIFAKKSQALSKLGRGGCQKKFVSIGANARAFVCITQHL